jgi:hypothetical protein
MLLMMDTMKKKKDTEELLLKFKGFLNVQCKIATDNTGNYLFKVLVLKDL